MPVTPAHIGAAASAIAAHVRRTPTFEMRGEEFGVDATVAVKLEHLQCSGSFKGRGAAHFMATRSVGPAGVVAASGGNHGAAVAWAARRFGHDANIFVPTISAPAKVERLRSYGATVHQVGAVYAEALAASREFQIATGATSIHAYDDPVVIAGAGTCGMELDLDAPDLDAVMVACGGGGLASGVAAWFDGRTRMVICETEGTASFARAHDAGEPVDVEISGLAADALGATRIGDEPWKILGHGDTASVLVSDEVLAEAVDWLWETLRIVVEPSAATPVAALRSGAWTPEPGGRVGVIVCGANTAIRRG